MPADTIMPLRQTCDRCRELKVRCKSGAAQGASADASIVLSRPCARCSRVGVVCRYSPRHRSGRHAQREGQDEIEKHASNHRPLATPFSFPADQDIHAQGIDWSWGQDLIALGCTSELSIGGTGSSVNMPDYVGGGRDMPIPFPDGKERNEVSNGTIVVSPASEHPTKDPTSRGVGALDVLDLNTRASRMLQSMTSERASDIGYPSNDEMIDVASCLLKIIEQLCHQINSTNRRHQDQSPPDSGSPLTRTSVDTGDSGGQPAAVQSLDLSTAIMALACHQRIIDLFENVCSYISRGAHNDRPLPGSSQRATDGAIPSQEGAICSSNAQRFMTLELLTYLLHKLDRGQAQFANALRLNSSVGSVGSVGSVRSPTSSAESYPTVADENMARTEPGASSVNVAGRLIMDRVMEAQRGLLTQIKVAKQAVRGMDGI